MADLSFAQAVRKVRLAHRLTQLELQRGLGISDGSYLIKDWEAARKSRYSVSRLILRAMFHAEPTFARIAQEIWRLST